MNKVVKSILLVLVVAFLFNNSVVAVDALVVPTIPATERDALISLYNSTNGDSWTDNFSWLQAPGTECTWFGVDCGGGNSVISVVLTNNNLTGTLPTGLDSLTNLSVLKTNNNQIRGSIPSDIGNLSNLTVLYLANNFLTGFIPPTLGNLGNLSELRLYKNLLKGTIPAELGNLSNLTLLKLYGNQFFGEIPLALLNLGNLLDGKSDFRFNSLETSDVNVANFIEAKQLIDTNQVSLNFFNTQTLDPVNLVVTQGVDDNSLLLSWDTILFDFYEGQYEIYYSTVPGGPYADYGKTVDKTISSMEILGLDPGTKYYFSIRAVTFSHWWNPASVFSDYSFEASGTTTGVPILAFDLVFPVDGQDNMPTAFTFVWKATEDTNGEAISYSLYLCEDANLTVNCREINLAAVESIQSQAIYYGSITGGWIALLAGLSCFGMFKTKKYNTNLFMLLFLIIIVGIGGLTACGMDSVDNGSPLTSSAPPVLIEPDTAKGETGVGIVGLAPGTYYWKVDATNASAGVVSTGVSSFTVQ